MTKLILKLVMLVLSKLELEKLICTTFIQTKKTLIKMFNLTFFRLFKTVEHFSILACKFINISFPF